MLLFVGHILGATLHCCRHAGWHRPCFLHAVGLVVSPLCVHHSCLVSYLRVTLCCWGHSPGVRIVLQVHSAAGLLSTSVCALAQPWPAPQQVHVPPRQGLPSYLLRGSICHLPWGCAYGCCCVLYCFWAGLTTAVGGVALIRSDPPPVRLWANSLWVQGVCLLRGFYPRSTLYPINSGLHAVPALALAGPALCARRVCVSMCVFERVCCRTVCSNCVHSSKPYVMCCCSSRLCLYL